MPKVYFHETESGAGEERGTRITRAQEGMLSAEGPLAGKPSPFHLLVSADVTGRLDVARLKAVLARVTDRHTSLRTVFTRDATTGRPGRRVLPGWQPAVLEQKLPLQPSGVGVIEVVHRLLTPEAPQLLRPYDRPAVVFVLTHVGPERAVLSVLAHHMILDGWSVGLLWDEITAGYAAEDAAGSAAPGMELIAEAEQALLAKDLVSERARMLLDWPFVAEIPSDLERPGTRTFAGTRLPFTLTEEARSGCAALAASLGVTRNIVLMAAWVLVVARRAALSRLIVGVPTVGRSSTAEMGVIGGATGLGPVACELPADGTVADYVRRTARAVRETLKYGRVPFEDLVSALSAGGDLSRNPLAQIAFGAHNELVPGTLPAGDVSFDITVGHTGGTAYDALLSILRWEPAPALELEYADSVLSAQDATALAGSFDRSLVDMAAAPDGPLSAITTITTAQRDLLHARETGPAAETTAGLWQLIEASAERHPEAVAIRDRDPGNRLTYRQLLTAAAAQSARLTAAGVGTGDRVAVAADRSISEIVAVLAVLRTGAAYVGIDAGSPPAEAEAILRRADVSVILGTPDRLATLGTAKDGRVAMPVIDPSAPAAGRVTAPAAPDPERIAYLAFTSGTTGHPKGAMIPCRAVVRLAHNPAFLSPGASERFVRLAPLAFDASTLEIFAPLLAGGTIEVYPGDRVTPNALATFLEKRSITGLWLSAGLFRLAADYRPSAFRHVIQLLTGGDVVPPVQVADVLRACPGLRITNGYGPTENTTFTTVHHVDDPAGALTTALPIGRPIQGTGVLVLDPSGHPVPPGGIGELFTYGDGLSQGYVGMPAETAEAFGTFGRDDGRLLYRTGDLVRWDDEGSLRFLGRRDRQVKIRGFRVEPDHVASVLRRHPDVRDAAVIVVPLGNGDQQILAAVSTVGGEPLPATLPSFAAGQLPGHAVPWLWAAVEEFPVTANGKLDAARLTRLAAPHDAVAESPDDPAPHGTDRPEADADEVEKAIADAWQQVLGHSDFSRSDWFFDVGGDSLLLIRVHAILGDTLSAWQITVGDLYTCSTVGDLAAKLRAEAGERMAS
jgi:amino acid adenylation domain-containing protein